MPITDTAFVDGRGWTLSAALGLARGEVVALVGGGGKTTALFLLAAELRKQYEQQRQASTSAAAPVGGVLVTTTTHIWPPDPQQFPALILEERLDHLIAAARAAFSSHSVVVAARRINPDGRLAGIDPDWVKRLRDELSIVNVLVEADGSKGRPFKSPESYEPVIPPLTDLVVPVVGLSAVGQPLSPDVVHRPERVCALTGAAPGDPLSPELIAAVIQHPDGGARGAPAHVRIVPLLNQADEDGRLQAGRQLARALMRRNAGRAILAAVREPEPVREIALGLSAPDQSEAPLRNAPPQVSAIVLAAGLGKRMGQLKLGLRLGGKALLRRVVESALASEVHEVVVVLGHGAAELQGELPSDPRLRAVYNPCYAEGQSFSVKIGVSALHPRAEAAIFLLGDQPLIHSATIDALIGAFRSARPVLVQPVYRGTPGNPVLFARALFPELLQVAGDQGGREVLAGHRDGLLRIDLDTDLPRDVDTAEDYERLVGSFRSLFPD